MVSNSVFGHERQRHLEYEARCRVFESEHTEQISVTTGLIPVVQNQSGFQT